MVVANMDSLGELREITVECRIRIRDGLTAQPRGEVLIERGDSAGRVRSIQLTNTQIGSPVTTGLIVRGHASSGHLVEGVSIDRCQVSAPSGPVPTVQVLGATAVRIVDCTIAGNGRWHVVTGGTADGASSGLEVLRTTLTGIGRHFAGVRLPQTDDFRVEDCLFQGAPGDDVGGVGIAVGGSSREGVVRQNHFSGLSTPGVQGNLRSVDVYDNRVTG